MAPPLSKQKKRSGTEKALRRCPEIEKEFQHLESLSILDHRHLLHSDSAFSQRRFECRSFPGSPLPAGKLSNASASEKNLFSPDKEQEYVFL